MIHTIKTRLQAIGSTRLAWIAAFLCVGCCAAIPLLVLAGVTGIAGLAWYLHAGTAVFLVLSVALFARAAYKKSKASSCDNECKSTDAINNS